MTSKHTIAAAVAALFLTWGTAHAGSEAVEGMQTQPEVTSPNTPAQAGTEHPGIIIFEIQRGEPGGEAAAHEQMMLGMLLLQLLGALQAEGENGEVQVVQPQSGNRI